MCIIPPGCQTPSLTKSVFRNRTNKKEQCLKSSSWLHGKERRCKRPAQRLMIALCFMSFCPLEIEQHLGFHGPWYWRYTGGEWIRTTFDLRLTRFTSEETFTWIVSLFIHLHLLNVFPGHLWWRCWQQKENEKVCVGDVRRTDVLVEYSSLPINGNAMWDASETAGYCCSFPWFFIQKMFLRSCGTDAFPSYDRKEAYATPETQTNILWCFHRRYRHSSDSELNPLSLPNPASVRGNLRIDSLESGQTSCRC